MSPWPRRPRRPAGRSRLPSPAPSTGSEVCFGRPDRHRRSERPKTGSAGQEREPHRPVRIRSEEHTSELQSHFDLVCRLLLKKKKKKLRKAVEQKKREVSMESVVEKRVV